MKVIGFWETAIGEATTTELVYILAFEDLGHYQRAWDAFIADPEWQAAKRLTEVGGPLVNVGEFQNYRTDRLFTFTMKGMCPFLSNPISGGSKGLPPESALL